MKRIPLNYIKIACCIGCFYILGTATAQWPQWRGQLRDGASAETNLLKEWPAYGPKLLWTSDTVGDGFSSAIIHNKIIYTTGTKDSVEVLSAIDFNGKLVWQQPIGKASKGDWPQSWSTPTFYKGKLYAFTVPGDISCVDSETGVLDWKINVPKKFGGTSISSGGDFCESPLVLEDKVIITPCGMNTTIVALNSATGETVWTSESLADSAFLVSPVLVQGEDGKLIVTSTKNHILAVDFSSGKIVWKEKTLSSYYYIPLPGNKQVYFSNRGGNGKMLTISNNLNGFSFLWSDTLKVYPMGGTVRLGNRIYSTSGVGKGLYCVDWETGKTLSINKEISAADLIVADGMIYGYEDRSGRVFLIKPNGDYTDLVSSFRVKTGRGPHIAHPSIADGTLFIRHGKYLMAYDVKQP